MAVCYLPIELLQLQSLPAGLSVFARAARSRSYARRGCGARQTAIYNPLKGYMQLYTAI